MASILNVTPLPTVKVSAINDAQALWDAIDVLGFDVLDLEIGAVQFSATSFTVSIITSNQNEVDDDSWKTVFSFSSISSAPTYEIKSQNMGFLRYIRWKVTAWSGAGTAQFWIRGVARKYGGG